MVKSKNLKIGIDMQFRSCRSGVYSLINKFCNLDYEYDWEGNYINHGRRVCIPMLIWNDGRREWSRWYWFKDKYEHLMRGHYIGFK